MLLQLFYCFHRLVLRFADIFENRFVVPFKKNSFLDLITKIQLCLVI